MPQLPSEHKGTVYGPPSYLAQQHRQVQKDLRWLEVFLAIGCECDYPILEAIYLAWPEKRYIVGEAGITIGDLALREFTLMKLRRVHKWMIFKIVREREIELEQVGLASGVQGFCASLSRTEPRFGVVEFQFKGPEGPKTELVFVFSVPPDSRIRQRMIYAATQQSLRLILAVGVEVTAEPDEVNEELLEEKCSRW